MTDLSTLSVGDRMQRCRHENVVPHSAPDMVWALVEPRTGPRTRIVRKIRRTYDMKVVRCVDCDIRWEAT